MLEHEAFRHQQIQSVHNLTQALQMGLQHSLTTVVRDASYHLLDCVGSFDAHSSAQMLALFQVMVILQKNTAQTQLVGS